MFHMAPARITTIALALCTCFTFAQEHPKSVLTVAVKDQSGAVIPGGHITVTDEATGERVDGLSNATGQAAVPLDQGSYELRVVAAGFQQLKVKSIEVKADTYREVTLATGALRSGYPTVSSGPEMPLERPPLAAEIPLMPMQQLVLTSTPLHHRRRWL
jgi:hypothetical protein